MEELRLLAHKIEQHITPPVQMLASSQVLSHYPSSILRSYSIHPTVSQPKINEVPVNSQMH